MVPGEKIRAQPNSFFSRWIHQLFLYFAASPCSSSTSASFSTRRPFRATSTSTLRSALRRSCPPSLSASTHSDGEEHTDEQLSVEPESAITSRKFNSGSSGLRPISPATCLFSRAGLGAVRSPLFTSSSLPWRSSLFSASPSRVREDASSRWWENHGNHGKS